MSMADGEKPSSDGQELPPWCLCEEASASDTSGAHFLLGEHCLLISRNLLSSDNLLLHFTKMSSRFGFKSSFKGQCGKNSKHRGNSVNLYRVLNVVSVKSQSRMILTWTTSRLFLTCLEATDQFFKKKNLIRIAQLGHSWGLSG